VRFLDAFVGSLDLHALDFCQGPMRGHGLSALRSGGAAQTVSLWLSHRIRSSRLLEAECHRNVEVIWLLAAGAGLQNHRRLPEGQPQAAAGSEPQFTVLCQS